jgi:PD-(D/E)XK endonuclease
MDSISDLELGRAAEHLVVADLILSGHRAYLTEQGLPYDVVIDRNGRLLRVQVKASRGVKRMPGRAVGMGYLYNVRRAGKRGKRQYETGEFDIIALVAMDIRVIAYLPFSDRVLQTIHLRPPGYQHHPRAERRHAIDQFPVEAALAALTGSAPVLPPKPRAIDLKIQGALFEVA